MSIKLNENQLIAVHLIASGVKASNISKQIGLERKPYLVGDKRIYLKKL